MLFQALAGYTNSMTNEENTKCEICEIETAEVTKWDMEIQEDEEGHSIDIKVATQVCRQCEYDHYDG